MMEKYNLFLLKNQKWQNSAMQQSSPVSQPEVESSIQYSFIFSIVGAEQLYSIIPINIHLNNMGDFTQMQMHSLFEETIYYTEL